MSEVAISSRVRSADGAGSEIGASRRHAGPSNDPGTARRSRRTGRDATVAVSRAMGVVVVTSHGHLGASAAALDALLIDLIEDQGNLRVVLDARDVASVDPVSVAVLARSAAAAARRGGGLTVADPTTPSPPPYVPPAWPPPSARPTAGGRDRRRHRRGEQATISRGGRRWSCTPPGPAPRPPAAADPPPARIPSRGHRERHDPIGP